MFADAQYDVYVTAPGSEKRRLALIPGLVMVHPLDESRADALVRGERIRLRDNAKEGDALKIAAELRALGFEVQLESRAEPLEAVELERAEHGDDAPRVDSSIDNPFFDFGAGLVGLDGDDEPGPQKAHSVAARAPTPPAPAPAPRFRPTNLDDGEQQIGLDRTPSASRPEMDAAPAPPPIAERCGTHDIELVRGRCSRCAADDAYVKSRVMGGKLRDKPELRIGIGIGAGLFIGWIISAPMARRGEMRVRDLHAQAARERARPTEEGQARAVQLDAEADDLANGAFAKTYGTWALVTAVVTAAWLKLS